MDQKDITTPVIKTMLTDGMKVYKGGDNLEIVSKNYIFAEMFCDSNYFSCVKKVYFKKERLVFQAGSIIMENLRDLLEFFRMSFPLMNYIRF